MKRAFWLLPVLLGVLTSQVRTQIPPDTDPPFGQPPREDRLPGGKSRSEAILKADRESSLKDADQLAKLADEFKVELEKADHNVLSMAQLKRLDEMEKLTRRIRGRMKRY